MRRSPCGRWWTVRSLALSLLLLTLPAGVPVQAQGCAQCRDNAAATPPSTQKAYRRAIGLMTLVAGTIFAGSLVVLKKLE